MSNDFRLLLEYGASPKEVSFDNPITTIDIPVKSYVAVVSSAAIYNPPTILHILVGVKRDGVVQSIFISGDVTITHATHSTLVPTPDLGENETYFVECWTNEREYVAANILVFTSDTYQQPNCIVDNSVDFLGELFIKSR